MQGCTRNGTERFLGDFHGTERISWNGTDLFAERNGLDRNGLFSGTERNGVSGTDYFCGFHGTYFTERIFSAERNGTERNGTDLCLDWTSLKEIMATEGT